MVYPRLYPHIIQPRRDANQCSELISKCRHRRKYLIDLAKCDNVYNSMYFAFKWYNVLKGKYLQRNVFYIYLENM